MPVGRFPPVMASPHLCVSDAAWASRVPYAQRGKTDASRTDFLYGLVSQELAEHMGDCEGLSPLRRKATGSLPRWG
jgi:hypothetical protein